VNIIDGYESPRHYLEHLNGGPLRVGDRFKLSPFPEKYLYVCRYGYWWEDDDFNSSLEDGWVGLSWSDVYDLLPRHLIWEEL